jgi:NAD(P)-dependent dehydrogenase (short-subunit alcohol dehydrogenase family)
MGVDPEIPLEEIHGRREHIPMGGCGRVSGFSDLIAFLASGNSSGITGQNFRISRPV